MIQTREDLKFYLKEDRKRYGRMPWRIGILLGKEASHAFRVVRALRYYEYALNNSSSVLGKIRLIFRQIRFKQLSFKYRIFLKPNAIGYGLRIVHIGGGIIANCNKIGNCFVISSGCIVGNKDSKENVATIGDNVEMAIGSKVIGKITIGNNVIIAPNSVVVKDVPDNAVVSGVPAKIIKYKNLNSKC